MIIDLSLGSRKANIAMGIALVVAVLNYLNPLARVHIGQVRAHIGNLAVEILQKSSEVQTFRVVPTFKNSEGMPPPPNQVIDDCYVTATGPIEKGKFCTRLSSILLDNRTYGGVSKHCTMIPGIVFRYKTAEGTLDIILCFHCSQIATITRNADGKVVNSSRDDFGSNSKELVYLANEALPNNPALKKL